MPAKKKRWGEPWTARELKLLGKTPDSVFARRNVLTIKAVATMREKQRILFRAPRRRWTAREIRMLGKQSDCELARRLSRSRADVRTQRVTLKVPPFISRPYFKAWNRAEEKLLGKVSDAIIARRFNRTLESVKVHRSKMGIPVSEPISVAIRQSAGVLSGQSQIRNNRYERLCSEKFHRLRFRRSRLGI